MRAEKRYIAYAEKNIVSLITEANDILRHRFNSDVRLEYRKPRFYPPSNYVGVEWVYTHPKRKKAKRVGRVFVTELVIHKVPRVLNYSTTEWNKQCHGNQSG